MKRYTQIDYQEALLAASKSMIRARDPVTLLRLITRFVDRQIRTTHVGVLLYDKKRSSFVLIDSKGKSGARIPAGFVRLDESDPLVMHFLPRLNWKASSQREAINLSVFQRIKSEANKSLRINGFALQEISSLSRRMRSLRTVVCIPSYYKNKLVALMVLGGKLSGEPYVESEIKLLATLANDVAMAVKNAELIKDLKDSLEREHQLLVDTASALVRAIDARDRYTRGHSERVSHYTLVVAHEMVELGLVAKSREFLQAAQLSGLLHDAGKIGIKDTILNKPTRLNDDEFMTMKAHVKIGANIIKPVQGLAGLCDGILYHHERWDGKGYPDGLKGEEIPMIGRIVSVVDSYDTMVTERPYCRAKTLTVACEELKRSAGHQFDPKIVEIFCDLIKTGRSKKRSYLFHDDMVLRHPGN